MHTLFRRSVTRSGIAAVTALAMSAVVLAPVSVAEETRVDTVVGAVEATGENRDGAVAVIEKSAAAPLALVAPPEDYTPPKPAGSAAQLSSGFNVLNSTESLSGKSISLSATLGPTGIIGLGWLFALVFIIARQANVLPTPLVDFSPSADALQGLSSRILPQPAR
ncbi:hypothetical protein M0E87_07585 [Corynebacterium sp. CCM 9185]|uniref:Secreted protein n=1 Tax=Corynebacterium marambiense TaxID=2765364 RepID=A0ABS0VXS1_9CORY|nr:hypothetical protein [Corynebacterium marambiense]MBI9000168.1 hypothetical protein [Corynebacterium marambiense]MCK7663522.1 hypothetical protein [Corynebacterium marambiense]MCX7542045.1 hypothetical protein [Corynebacterium marambiense]